jgi:hypothetical protein
MTTNHNDAETYRAAARYVLAGAEMASRTGAPAANVAALRTYARAILATRGAVITDNPGLAVGILAIIDGVGARYDASRAAE